jgi:hypothetical protein
MMTHQTAKETLKQWISLLDEIASTEIDCEMTPDTLTENLDRRQKAINQIQQLDASLTAVREFRRIQGDGDSAFELDRLMVEGRRLSDSIRDANSQTIEIAKEKRGELLHRLRKNTLSKGYLAANHTLKIRPPAIVDGNA